MALSWVAGVVGLVLTLLVYRGDLFLRVELSIVVGGVLALVAQAATLVALLRGGREVDAGDLLEALVDSPVQP
jgi:hypothetical protein